MKEPNGNLTSYTYDQAGNRATETITANKQTTQNVYTYNAQNRLERVTTSLGETVTSTTYTYDNNGNQLTIKQDGKIITTNTYDVWNQLIETVSGGSTIVNTYNGEGLRVAKDVDGVKTLYLYEYDKVVLEVDEENNVIARNIYGFNLLQRTVGAESYYYLYNGHADVTALIDVETGSIAGTYYYDAFGNILEQTGDVDNSITYAGYQYDEETGLYYLNARMYDPKIARFLQEDTYTGDINDPLSLNLYTYCANNPLVYYDPSGHFGEGIAKWWSDMQEGLRILTDKEEREESMKLIMQYSEDSWGKKTALGLATTLGATSDLVQEPVVTLKGALNTTPNNQIIDDKIISKTLAGTDKMKNTSDIVELNFGKIEISTYSGGLGGSKVEAHAVQTKVDIIPFDNPDNFFGFNSGMEMNKGVIRTGGYIEVDKGFSLSSAGGGTHVTFQEGKGYIKLRAGNLNLRFSVGEDLGGLGAFGDASFLDRRADGSYHIFSAEGVFQIILGVNADVDLYLQSIK